MYVYIYIHIYIYCVYIYIYIFIYLFIHTPSMISTGPPYPPGSPGRVAGKLSLKVGSLAAEAKSYLMGFPRLFAQVLSSGIYIYIYVYVYICIEREREREIPSGGTMGPLDVVAACNAIMRTKFFDGDILEAAP